MRWLSGLSWLLLLLPVVAQGQVIADRTTLNSLVGASGKTADFESFTISNGGATVISSISVLDAASVINSQGPNLVPSGVSFTFNSGFNLQWNGANYYGSPSREILSNQNPLQITFAVAAKAFGVDLRAYAGYPATATVTVYAADNTTVLSTIPNLTLATSGVPIFFGYQSASGIGRVVLTNSGQSWSPIIDNLTFSVIPEPPPHVLLGGGLVIVAMTRRQVRRPGGTKQERVVAAAPAR
jgi:hypothetical protein